MMRIFGLSDFGIRRSFWLNCSIWIFCRVFVSSSRLLYEPQQHGEESEYPNKGKDDRHREQRRLLPLSRRSRDYREVTAPEISKPPVVFPNRNHQGHDPA